MLYIGVDLGGTNIAAGLVDEEGHILHKCSVPTGVERGTEAVIADMAALCQRIIDETGHKASDIKAIGVGVPGICHPSNGVVEFCTNLFWHQVPLREIMNRTLDIPVYIGNDATVAGLAESVAGVSKGVANSVFLTLGTGVGGGIVVDHKVYSGTHGIGSELGHMVIVADGEPCTCGNHGCWERYTSATAMIRMGREAAAKYPDSAILTACGGTKAEPHGTQRDRVRARRRTGRTADVRHTQYEAGQGCRAPQDKPDARGGRGVCMLAPGRFG